MSQPNNLEFITNDNIEMLWDLILDTIGSNIKTNDQLSNTVKCEVCFGHFVNTIFPYSSELKENKRPRAEEGLHILGKSTNILCTSNIPTKTAIGK